jgi:hypothetical protein
MQTKPFTNMFGTEVQLTKEQFVKRWTDKTNDFVYLFSQHGMSGELQLFIESVEQNAGALWDKSK